jgi:hypothetical protein
MKIVLYIKGGLETSGRLKGRNRKFTVIIIVNKSGWTL